MAGEMSITERLQEEGFRFKGSCQCDGYMTLKYERNGTEVRWRRNAYTFKITGKTNWLKLTQLETELQKLVPKEA